MTVSREICFCSAMAPIVSEEGNDHVTNRTRADARASRKERGPNDQRRRTRCGPSRVEADAQSMDSEAHKANRELAKRISAAVAAAKPSDDGVPRFVLGWRLYPNRANPFWQDAGGVHNCGCGCACFSEPGP